jgi:hypothetical protein
MTTKAKWPSSSLYVAWTCLGQVAGVVALDEVRDDFRVGLGVEGVPFGDERALELAEVLDDAVEHDGDVAVLAARERVRILLVDRPVRRPARVAEAVVRARVVRARCILQVLQVPTART